VELKRQNGKSFPASVAAGENLENCARAPYQGEGRIRPAGRQQDIKTTMTAERGD
jgi:hypothetical protein